MSIERVLEELVVSGSDDWVMALEVVGLVRSEMGLDDPAAVRRAVIDVVTAAVLKGWVEVGETPRGLGFQSWKLPLPEALARIEMRWDALSEPFPSLGEVFWLANTPKGAREAERILAHPSPDGTMDARLENLPSDEAVNRIRRRWDG